MSHLMRCHGSRKSEVDRLCLFIIHFISSPYVSYTRANALVLVELLR